MQLAQPEEEEDVYSPRQILPLARHYLNTDLSGSSENVDDTCVSRGCQLSDAVHQQLTQISGHGFSKITTSGLRVDLIWVEAVVNDTLERVKSSLSQVVSVEEFGNPQQLQQVVGMWFILRDQGCCLWVDLISYLVEERSLDDRGIG